MRYTETTDDSAVSPVIGVILMVAITVILAAVIGTFVLGLGENVDGTTSAGVSIDQNAGTGFSVTIVDAGNLDTAGIVGPDGARSAFASTEDLLAAGATVHVADQGAWSRQPDPTALGAPTAGSENETGLIISGFGEPENSTAIASGSSLASGTLSGATADQLPGVDDADTYRQALQQADANECYISHGANVVSGVQVGGAPIGCTGLGIPAAVLNGDVTIQDAAEASTLSSGSPITYEAGAEYSFVGTVDGSENVVQSFTTADD